MTPHLTALLRVAIPSFILTGLLSLLLPTIAGFLQSLIGGWLKKITSWQGTVSPIYGQALNIVVGILVGKVMIGAGIGVSATALQCLNDPTTAVAASCIDSQTVGNLITYLTTALSAVIGGHAVSAHVAWKRASLAERSLGAGRGK
jgi:hypothetical protein